jgi:hypothetical protein
MPWIPVRRPAYRGALQDLRREEEGRWRRRRVSGRKKKSVLQGEKSFLEGKTTTTKGDRKREGRWWGGNALVGAVARQQLEQAVEELGVPRRRRPPLLLLLRRGVRARASGGRRERGQSPPRCLSLLGVERGGGGHTVSKYSKLFLSIRVESLGRDAATAEVSARLSASFLRSVSLYAEPLSVKAFSAAGTTVTARGGGGLLWSVQRRRGWERLEKAAASAGLHLRGEERDGESARLRLACVGKLFFVCDAALSPVRARKEVWRKS